MIEKEKQMLIDFLSAIDTGITDIIYDDSEKTVLFETVHTGIWNSLF